MRRVDASDSVQRFYEFGQSIVDLVLCLSINWDSSGLKRPMDVLYLVPEVISVCVKFVIRELLFLLLQLQLTVERPFSQVEMLG